MTRPTPYLPGLDSDAGEVTQLNDPNTLARVKAMEAEEARRLDISEPLIALADMLGVTYADIFKVTISPRNVTVMSYRRNDEGKVIIDPATGDTAVTMKNILVRT